MKKTCQTCDAFAALNNECRAKSPQVFVIEGPKGPVPAGIFPATRADHWCCEWRVDPTALN